MKDERILRALDLYTNNNKIDKEANQTESMDKRETFDVVEASNDSQKIRKVSIELAHEKFCNGHEDYFVLTAMYEDTWEPIFKVCSDDDSIENDYISSVERLKNIHAQVELKNFDEAHKLFDTFVVEAKKISGNEKASNNDNSNQNSIGIEAHTLIELIKTGHADVIPSILKKEGWDDDTINSYMDSIRNGEEKK